MPQNINRQKLAWAMRACALCALLCRFGFGNSIGAQGILDRRHLTPAPSAFAEEDTPASVPPTRPFGSREHSFFDKENIWLFSGVGAARTLDYFSTLNMRRRGRQEILLSDWLVDHHALFAGVEAGGTVLSIGASYLLHRTGHHRLERAFSMVHIGLATAGAVRNYSLQTFHFGNREIH
jgi:hypothetical protein